MENCARTRRTSISCSLPHQTRLWLSHHRSFRTLETSSLSTLQNGTQSCMIHEAPELCPAHYYEHQLSQQQQRTDAKVNRVFWMTECWINTFLLHYMQKDAKIWRQEKSCVQAASATVGGDQRSPPQFLLWGSRKKKEEEKKRQKNFPLNDCK